MRQWKLRTWGLVGALLSTIGDLTIMSAITRTGSRAYALLILGIAIYGGCGGAWYALAKITDGNFADSASSWNVAGAILTLIVAVYRRERQTAGQWIGFFLIFAGILVRSFCAPQQDRSTP